MVRPDVTFDDGGPYNEPISPLPKREIFFPGGRTEMCEVVSSDEKAKLMLICDPRNHTYHIARPYLGTWGAFAIQDLYYQMVRDRQPPIIEHGFDIVDFGSYENWFSIKLHFELKMVERKEDRFEWEGKEGLRMTTQANPETGEYGPGNRERQSGFASHIGITGPKDVVDPLVKAIKRTATHIKDETLGRRPYI